MTTPASGSKLFCWYKAELIATAVRRLEVVTLSELTARRENAIATRGKGILAADESAFFRLELVCNNRQVAQRLLRVHCLSQGASKQWTSSKL